ncbi:protein timeless homolog [Penaeus japonicus]|uniref:protein timeless homolog n=1 Tax=Penaeus japonicus TaxID=27405 RepID=UPI001C712AA4|nr:protein timeless homolog [Penaeus japonicus]XP_042877505.1 protein timeless homolog [Penaeus japonicus]
MADALLHAELLAACSALGYSDGAKYHKEADCLETVKDLVRYLRKDDESHEIRRALGDTRVMQTDLIPIVREHSQDGELFDVTLRLLVNLTNPVLLLFREELPEEKVTRQQFLHLVSQQQGYKEAFVEEKLWAVLVGKLGELLQLDWENRQEDDRLIIERILILVRNILSVPASPEDEKRTDDDASVHDQVLWALHLAGFEDLLLYIASSENEQDLCMHSLEIISLMLREQDPAQLAQAGLQRSQSEKEKDEKELLEIRQREALKKQQQRQKQYSARHSRFGGTYYVQNMKSISDRDIISHQPVSDIRSLNFDKAKRPKKVAKNRMAMRDVNTTRRSTLAIRLFLQEFCVEFLNGAYNSIMYIVKDNLNRARAQEHDESYYLWAMKFFMEFNRHHQFKIELVSETLSVQTFHYIQTNLDSYYEMMTTDKKKIPLWSRRMHKALRAYQELLMTLAYMDKSDNESVRESSKVLKCKVFYVVEYREMVMILLQNYDPVKLSSTYLKDLVETTHIFLKLLESFCGKSKHVIVQKKVKKAKKKKAKAQQKTVNEPTEHELQDIWDDMSAELSAVVQGEAGDLPDTVPFDALSEQTDEEQKEAAMRRINLHLRKKELAEGVSLMRSAREVWPEGDVFGSQTMEHSEEFLALREIFMANLNPVENTPVQEPTEEEEYDDDEEEEEESLVQISEQEFDFTNFIRRFANTKIMQAYCRLFKSYGSNSSHTNHCILRMFHRIAWDNKLPAMFFQASLFCVFQKAMDDPRQKTNDSIKEIVKFAKYIVRQFFKVAETNPKVFVELLFFKTNKEALEIECGYAEQDAGKKAMKLAWREEEEEELVRLFEEFTRTSPEGADDKDVADLILENLINQTRTRRMVIKKLKDMHLIRDVKELTRKTVKVKPAKVWSEVEEHELRMLFEEYKDAMDIVGRIMDNMIMKRPKHRVVDKILELGLVEDKKELRKKRPKKPQVKKSKRSSYDDDDDNDGDSGEEDDVQSEQSSDDEGGAVSRQEVPKKSKATTFTVPVVTPALITKSLNTVLEANMQEAVEWIAGVLLDVAEDREEDGDFEPVPILAMTETCTDAMEDEKFKELLKLIGIQPPLTNQEMFWRVPSKLTVEGLRKRSQYLKQGISGVTLDSENADVPLEPVEVQASQEEKPKKKKSSKTQSKSKPKAKKTKKRQNDLSDLENMNPEDKENYYKFVVSEPSINTEDVDDSVPLVPQRSRVVEDDSSDDETPLSSISQVRSPLAAKRASKKRQMSDEGNDSGAELKTAEDKSSKKKRRLIIADDSDEDTPVMESHDLKLHLDTESSGLLDDTGMNTDEDAGNEKANTSRRRMLDSDSEDDVPLASGRQKARAVIDSDED